MIALTGGDTPVKLNPARGGSLRTLRGVTSSASSSLPPGSRFGSYVLGECIGRGGMGHVYRAEHSILHRAVAPHQRRQDLLQQILTVLGRNVVLPEDALDARLKIGQAG